MLENFRYFGNAKMGMQKLVKIFLFHKYSNFWNISLKNYFEHKILNFWRLHNIWWLAVFLPATMRLFSMTWRAITWFRANKCSLCFFSSSIACFWRLSGIVPSSKNNIKCENKTWCNIRKCATRKKSGGICFHVKNTALKFFAHHISLFLLFFGLFFSWNLLLWCCRIMGILEILRAPIFCHF